MAEDDREEKLELLRRAVDEVDVLQAIYGGSHDDEDAASSVRVVSPSPSHFERLRLLLEDGDAGASAALAAAAVDVPQLDVDMRVPIGLALGEEEDGNSCGATIQFHLPSGYPENAATIALISLDALRRSYRDEIAKNLNERAAESAASSQEAMLDIIDYLKELVSHFVECDAMNAADQTVANEGKDTSTAWGRRWIWVHHITNTSRCKSIVEEARELNLRGYLKPGYPGIVLIEGNGVDCDTFVTFIKGNKSRPGGFGRNWGHHVRGHIEPAENVLPDGEFRELDEDLAVLANICRDCLLEDEFKEYVLQHKG
mmetsp:Transcript_28103/g.81241  ORF Transcript_28103/g.81241 Transcript_28103/m.81241 type:complete len:314 (+) Transcript_28103:16-957(+)